MKKRLSYKAKYTDEFGTTEIVIENDFKHLYTEIDGVQFSGSEFSSLVIIDKPKYKDQQLKRFTFFDTPIYNRAIVEQALCSCVFELLIPQFIIDKTNGREFLSDLKMEYFLGRERPKPRGGLEEEKLRLSLTIGEKFYLGSGDLIEVAFDQIQHQFENRYQFKNCYGCMYGDYSVYGQTAFGAMLCFVGQKERYKQVNNKQNYMELTKDYKQVQEIFCCDKYELRKAGIGYRG